LRRGLIRATSQRREQQEVNEKNERAECHVAS
jgi:hypothetical protein